MLYLQCGHNVTDRLRHWQGCAHLVGKIDLRSVMKYLAMCILLAAGMLTAALVGQESRPAGPGPVIKVGEPFPDLVLPSLEDGRPVSLAQFRGKKVILHVFASW